MKTLKGMTLSMLGLIAAIAAVGCGDTIQGCQTTAQMLGSERQKIKRVAHHTNEWRDAR